MTTSDAPTPEPMDPEFVRLVESHDFAVRRRSVDTGRTDKGAP